MSNLDLWDKVRRVPQEHLKGFKRAGGFTGTAIKPMWSVHRMTEEFGACGEGWGHGEPVFQIVHGENKEVMVYCHVTVWHGKRENVLYGVGGDKVVTYIKANEQYNTPERWNNDDEAFKKAFTDAVTNALKFLGVGADVHMGLWDGNKYVDEAPAPKAGGMSKTAAPPSITPPEYTRISRGIKQIIETGLMDDLNAWYKSNVKIIEAMAGGWNVKIMEEFGEAKAALKARAA
jgi:hypothetical protein